MFWAVTLMFHPIWWQCRPFEFWYIWVEQPLQIVSNFCILLWSVPVVPATENANEIWEAIKPEVKATIEEYFDQEDIVDEDDGPVEFQGDMDDALQW